MDDSHKTIDRRQFLKMSGMLGLSLPFSAAIVGCNKANTQEQGVGKVLILGAGAAGLTAGYLLQQQGIDYEILEASSIFGGRMKRTTEFADFPIPLGAEWIHVKSDILEKIVNDDSVKIDVETKQYDPKVDYALYQGQKLSLRDIGFKHESKFINATWFDFFEQYIVPHVEDRITFNAVAKVIDYTSETIQVETQNKTYSADRVIVTIPVKLLQNGEISFRPELPKNKREAIAGVKVWDGCKAFIEFKEKFYPAAVAFEISPESAGEKLYYDAAYGQNTTQHVLGLFAVGTGTRPYVDLGDNELIEYMLRELDELFEGQASPNYVKHIFQNWNAEPYAKGAYVTSHENWRTVRTLGKRVADRLFFAGTAYTEGTDWSSVHTAARSAKRAVKEILKS